MSIFQAVGVSSHTGAGLDEFIAAVESSREEYEKFARFVFFSLSKMVNSLFLEFTFQS